MMKSQEIIRCGWCEKSDLYRKYHDEEWGVPVYDDDSIFEFLVLESFQAGLSWLTILNKRENFRKAFEGFQYKKIAQYGEPEIERLLQDPGIVRNRLKIRATINNAARFMEVQKEFGNFSAYIWQFVNHQPQINNWENLEDVPARSEISDALSKDLKRRGFRFLGSTVMYAHMQATGMVNDHIATCWKRNEG